MLVVAGQVGDGLVEVGEVEVAGAGIGAGPGGDGRQRGGDRPGAAVQHPQPLPVGPLAGGGRVAGVQCGGGLAEVSADVDEVDEDRDFQAAFPGVGGDGGDLLLVPVDEEHPLAGPVRVAAVGLVECFPDHRVDAVGDGGCYPLVPRDGAGMGLAAGRRGGDVLRLADGGGEVGDRDDLGHLLDPGMGGIGWPIATGMIEGACRFVIEDRFVFSGARWSPDGAEDILKLRAIVVNGDLDDYMNYYKARYRDEIHLSRYAPDSIADLGLIA